MSTICLGILLELPHIQMPGWWGIYSLPHNSSCWTEKLLLLSSGAPNSPVHIGHPLFIVRCPSHVSRPLGSIAVDRWIWLLPRLSGAIARECLVAGLSAQIAWYPTGQSGAHRIGIVHCPVRHRSAGWLPTSWISSLFLLGFFCSWALDFYASFRSSFEVLYPQCLSPILFASCELQIQTLAKRLVHMLCW
jgi:hypothetical protein